MKNSMQFRRFWLPLAVFTLVLFALVITQLAEYSYWIFLVGFYLAYKNGWKSKGDLNEKILKTLDVETRLSIRKAEEEYYDKEDLAFFQKQFKG